VLCLSGDLFCRECALSNLLAQKKEIARLEKELERKLEEENEKNEIDEAEEQERAIREFELVQMGLEKKRKREGEDEVAENRTTKKKFELDTEEMLKVAKADRLKMRTQMDAEKVRIMVVFARPTLI
jgi:nitric oxide synthase-interacting protein